MKHFSHLNTAAHIIKTYSGHQPFHLFIKDFFRKDKKYGSKDRRQITHCCYCYFRLGQATKSMHLQDAIVTAVFLCTDKPNEILAEVQPMFNEKAACSFHEKCALLNIKPQTLQIFPFPDELSEGMDATAFNFSHLVQPDVFIRIRPGHRQTVIGKLEKSGSAFRILSQDCIALPAASKIDELLQVNKEVVIQDYSSQHTAALLQSIDSTGTTIKIWDCCAASGGKSIMANDMLNKIDLTVSDIRPAVLNNLKKRFSEAGIQNYTALSGDLTKDDFHLQQNNFDIIIADVPCTGSGTWGRTPERLLFFEEKEINHYQKLQERIVTAALPRLQTGGHFLYITCSVFKKENDSMVNFMLTHLPVELITMKLLKGYAMKADTMFAAIFKKTTQ